MAGGLDRPESEPRLSPLPPVDWFTSADYLAVNKIVQTEARPFDIATTFGPERRVVFFGERHDDLSQKEAIINHLTALKKQGLTHVALEMLNDKDMPAVRAYFDGTGDREVVLQQLKNRWSMAPGVPEKYMDLIDAIKEARLIPLALDPSLSGHDDSGENLFSERNEHWASVINGALKSDPAARVLVYSGRDHIGYGQNRDHANEILQDEYGQKSTVIDFTSPYDDISTIEGKVNKGAAELGLAKKEFLLPISPSQADRPADIILHQPD